MVELIQQVTTALILKLSNNSNETYFQRQEQEIILRKLSVIS